jgi:hypothetical protein
MRRCSVKLSSGMAALSTRPPELRTNGSRPLNSSAVLAEVHERRTNAASPAETSRAYATNPYPGPYNAARPNNYQQRSDLKGADHRSIINRHGQRVRTAGSATETPEGKRLFERGVSLSRVGFMAVRNDPAIVLKWVRQGWDVVRDGTIHAYHGFRLLYLNVKIGSGLLYRVLTPAPAPRTYPQTRTNAPHTHTHSG